MKFLHSKPHTQKGFTLFELLVSIGIFTLLTTTLLVKNSQYKGNTVITNLAYEMALIVRQAQVYGINVRQVGTGNFDYAYGVHFSFDPANKDSDGHVTSFKLFSDSHPTPVDGKYDHPNEDVELFNLSPGNWIENICLDVGGVPKCVKDGDFTTLDVMFKRPDPSAIFFTSGGTTNFSYASTAHVYILSSKGICRQIDINKTGQISVPDVDPSFTCS